MIFPGFGFSLSGAFPQIGQLRIPSFSMVMVEFSESHAKASESESASWEPES